MNKLTAEVARRHQRDLKSFQENPKIGLSLKEELYLQALEIALPILEQQERGEGWIEWACGKCPVDANAKVEFKTTSGAISRAKFLNWHHVVAGEDIIAYRIIPENSDEN